MRCKNCGWPNKPGEATCVKCSSPLGLGVGGGRLESLSAGAGNSGGSESQALGKTVIEGLAFSPANAADSANEQGKQCAKCGYPLRAGTEKCPNCQTPATSAAAYRPITGTVVCGAASPMGGTVNPYLNPTKSIPTFALEPIAREQERHAPQEMEFEGEETLLNRSNTDPTNPTITSARQAVVTCEAGTWYLQDQSALKTTCVSAAEKRPLKEGDIILLGNRMFVFHER